MSNEFPRAEWRWPHSALGSVDGNCFYLVEREWATKDQSFFLLYLFQVELHRTMSGLKKNPVAWCASDAFANFNTILQVL